MRVARVLEGFGGLLRPSGSSGLRVFRVLRV